MTVRIARVAVPVPLRQTFDFLIPSSAPVLAPGMRVTVPFGRRRLTGIITALTAHSELEQHRLKSIIKVLDDQPVLPNSLLRLIQWAADYYHHPIGEVWQTALPVTLRRGLALAPRREPAYCISAAGRERPLDDLRRSPAKQRIVAAARGLDGGCLRAERLESLAATWRQLVRQLLEDDWLEPFTTPEPAAPPTTGASGPRLNSSQQGAVGELVRGIGSYHCTVLFGVTGSGKTEVYLHLVEEVLRHQLQALLLVPEIGLTPQLIARFRARFKAPLAVLHSALSDGERHQAWWRARSGEAAIVIGTRSAVFTPLARPGVIIVDEEHDLSLKQQDGFRYHARDLAVYRAHLEHIPVVLGSATPSLETLANVNAGRYRRLSLRARTGDAELPDIHYLDMRRLPAEDGLSKPLIDAIRSRLENGEQTLLFLNRRGYAPVLFCAACGWQAHCQRCDARLTLHRGQVQLRCHHCAAVRGLPERCPECGGDNLRDLGSGTQKIETTLHRLVPAARVLRIDRDSTRRKDELAQRLNAFAAGEADVLVGTQLLTKGHDFDRVTLVGVLNADQGLFSIDFRAMEHLSQQILQVAGRAGRGRHRGEVLIQTMQPEHPYFTLLRRHDYEAFAKLALEERQLAHCPPYVHFALLRAESTQAGAALDFLRRAHRQAQQLCRSNDPAPVTVMDAVPSPMEKRAGRYRAQLLLSASQRGPLHAFLSSWLPHLESSRWGRRVRWSIDVDPVEMY